MNEIARHRKDDRLEVKIDSEVKAALATAAATDFTTQSEWTRQSLIERLRARGLLPIQGEAA